MAADGLRADTAAATLLRSLHSTTLGLDRKLCDARNFVDSFGGRGGESGATEKALRQSYLQNILQWLVGVLLSKSAGAGSAAASLAPQCWDLLAALIRCGADWRGTALSPNLAIPLTAAAQAGGAELGAAVANAVGQLSSASWKPGLEHTSSLLGAALTACQSSGRDKEWLRTATMCTRLLQSVTTDNSNPKKTFMCIASKRVLLPVLSAAFQGNTTGNEVETRALSQACKDLLYSTLLHPSNVVGIGDACAAGAANDVSNGEEAQATAKGSAKNEKKTQQSFHSMLCRTLMSAVQDGRSDAEAAAVFTATPWLLERFCDALRVHRDAEQEGSPGAGNAPHDTPAASKVSASKGGRGKVEPRHDFSFFCELGRLHVAGFKQSSAGNGNSAPSGAASDNPVPKTWNRKRKHVEGGMSPVNSDAARQEMAARGGALLMGVVAKCGVYRPTEDKSGKELQVIKGVVDSALASLSGSQHPRTDTLTVAQLKHHSAIAQLCAAVVEIEHRAIQPHIQRVWELLWTVGSPGDGAAEGLIPDGTAVAANVASAIIRSYGDLRQLEWMLGSLSPTLSTASERVVTSQPFVAALRGAIRNLHAGLAAPLVRWVADDIQKRGVEGGPASRAVSLSRGVVYDACLRNLRVDLPTAVPIAAAVSQLLASSFSATFLAALREPSPPEGVQVMFSLYRAALGLHRTCGHLHPSVPSLTGKAREGSDAGAAGYFTPLWVAAGQTGEEPRLSDISKAWGGTELPAEQRHPFCQAIIQRFETIHETSLHAHHSCPTATMSQRVEDVNANAAQDAGDVFSQELRTLAPHLAQQMAQPSAREATGTAESRATQSQLLANPRLCGLWLPHAEPSAAELALRSVISHFCESGDQFGLLKWFENLDAERVRLGFLPAVVAQLADDARSVLEPLLRRSPSDELPRCGGESKKRRLSSRKGSLTPAPVSFLGDGLQAALASTAAPYDLAPDPTAARASVESVMQQARDGTRSPPGPTMAAVNQAAEFRSLKFALSLFQHAPAEYFKDGLAFRGVKLLLHVELCLLLGLGPSITASCNSAANQDGTPSRLAFSLAELLYQCRASLGVCLSRVVDLSPSPSGTDGLLSWLWQSAEATATAALMVGSEEMLSITQQLLTATHHAGATALRLCLRTLDSPLLRQVRKGDAAPNPLLRLCMGADASGAHSPFDDEPVEAGVVLQSGDQLLRIAKTMVWVSRLQAALLFCQPSARPSEVASTAILCGPVQLIEGCKTADLDMTAGREGWLSSLRFALTTLAANILPKATSLAPTHLRSPTLMLSDSNRTERADDSHLLTSSSLRIAAEAANAAALALQCVVKNAGDASETESVIERTVGAQLECVVGLAVALKEVDDVSGKTPFTQCDTLCATYRPLVVRTVCGYMTAVSEMLPTELVDGAPLGDTLSPKMVACHIFCLRWIVSSQLRTLSPPSSEDCTTAVLESFRCTVLRSASSARNDAYSVLAKSLSNSSSVVDALPSLLLLEACFRAERNIAGWAALPAGAVFQRIAKATLRTVDTLTTTASLDRDPRDTAAHDTSASANICALSSAVTCLECIASKSRLFHMSPQQVARALRIPAQVCDFLFPVRIRQAAEHSFGKGTRGWGDECPARLCSKIRLVMSCCRMMGALVRHHHAASRRSMAIVSLSLRRMVVLLMEYSSFIDRRAPRHQAAPDTAIEFLDARSATSEIGGVNSCAQAVADVMCEVASQPQATISKYCVHIIGDFICAATASAKRQAAQRKAVHDMAMFDKVNRLLRRGAVVLYSICSKQEVQHLHALLATEPDALLHRQALQELKQDYEQDFKFTGKI